jgi:hypothetical protein
MKLQATSDSLAGIHPSVETAIRLLDCPVLISTGVGDASVLDAK